MAVRCLHLVFSGPGRNAFAAEAQTKASNVHLDPLCAALVHDAGRAGHRRKYPRGHRRRCSASLISGRLAGPLTGSEHLDRLALHRPAYFAALRNLNSAAALEYSVQKVRLVARDFSKSSLAPTRSPAKSRLAPA